jgi:hypothetical protein
LQAGDRPFDFNDDGSALFLSRLGTGVTVEIWRMDLPSGKRTLLRSITPGEAPATTFPAGAIVSRDAKKFAYEYISYNSTEFVVTGLH